MATRKGSSRLLTYILVGSIVVGAIAWRVFEPARAKDPDTAWRSAHAGDRRAPSLIEGHQEFGFDLLKNLAETPGENVFLSPYSIATALSMTYNGASGGTKDAMAETLHLEDLSLDAVNRGSAALKASLETPIGQARFTTANSLWAQKGFSIGPDFIRRNHEFFRAGLETLDIKGDPAGATKQINRWTERRTRGRIKRILDEPLNPQTVLVLVNAAHFKAPWANEFAEDATKDLPFTRHDGSTKGVPMMHLDMEVPYYRGDGYQAAALRYEMTSIRMVLLRPDTADGLPALIRRLDAPFWALLRKGLVSKPGVPGLFTVGLPRFRMEFAAELKDPLTDLGMGVVFMPAADFSAMGPGGLFIDRVSHKALLEVDEKGTEAAAATVVGELAGGSMPASSRLLFDHPFLCALEDMDTGEILFLGAVYEPK